MPSKITILVILPAIATLMLIIGYAGSKSIGVGSRPAPACPTCPVCQDYSDVMKTINTLSHQLGVESAGKKVDEMGQAKFQVGQYQKVEQAEADKVELQKYLRSCAKVPTAWFCFDGLLDRIEVAKGAYSYFLVINKVTMPQLFGICNFMWSTTSMDRWARHNNHTCKEFDIHYTEP